MFDPIGSAYVEITSNIKELQREIAGLKGHVDSSARNMETRFNIATRAISGLASVIGTIGIVKFGSDILQASTRLDSMEKGLTRTEGSLIAAKKRLAEFRDIAKDPGLEMGNLTRGYIQLKSINMESEKSIKFLRGVGNEIAKIGGQEEDLNRVVRQFVQMQGKGKVMAEDLMVIAESMPNIRKLMQEAFGTTSTEALQKAGVTAKEFFDKITESLGKQEKAIEGAQNAQTNFKGAIEQLNAALGAGILPTITEFLKSITKLIDKFNALPDSTKNVVGKFVMGGTGLLGVAFALGMIKTTLDAIGISSGLKAIIGLGGAKTAGLAIATTPALASTGAGAIAGAGLSKLGTIGLTIATATIAITSGFFIGGAIGNLLPKPEFAKGPIKPTKQTSEEKKALEKKSQEYMRAIYGGTAETSSELQGMINKATANMPIIEKIAIKPSELAISYADMIKEIGEASVDFLMNPYGYSTEAGKYQSKFIPRAGAGELGLLEPRQMAEMGVRTPELFPIGQVTGPQVGTTGIVGPSMRGGTVIDKDFLRETNTEWGKTYETQKKIVGIESDIDKANQKIIDGWSEGAQGMNDVRDAWDEYADEMINGTKKMDKEQSQFWSDMSYFATSAMDMTISKSIDDFYNHFGWIMSDTENSWKAFCNNLSAEFLKMLIKMEAEAEARNIFDALTGKKTSGEGLSSIVGKIGGSKSAEIPGGISTGESIASGIGTGATIAGTATAAAILGTIVWGYKVGEAGYDYWKQKQEFKEQISTPEGLTKTQLAQKDMLQQKWNIGKYENPEEGVYADVKGYEGSMKKLGIEPYPLAKGGMGIVTKPTMFMMGESGPESFNIQPLSKGVTNRSDNFVVNISFPNATLDSVDQNQIDRFISKAIPSLRRAVSNGELS